MTHNVEKMAIYCRVSKTDQVLENQELPLVQYCNGYNAFCDRYRLSKLKVGREE